MDRDSDGDGFFDGDEVNSGDDPSDPKSSPQRVKIRLEAEDGYLYAPMELAYDESASSGEYIRVPNGQGNVWNSSQDGGYAEYVS
ncbi:MAG: thrombospondin type 3 repeat-containing protein [Thermodesulfobacteriota bacterium]|nr:thrombospondin type 3 repeat-containing protein [Thermodesulfobacteriota bacterium]